MASIKLKFLSFSFSFFFHFLSLTHSATITLQNKCSHTIWPGILSGAGTAPLATTGFSLLPGASSLLPVPGAWSGRIWARTFCSTDSTGRFTCATADCGSGAVECRGACAAPPATLAEFTLNGFGGFDFYDVSVVDGYNIGMQIVAEGGKSGNCTTTGCIADLNGECPEELRVEMGGGEGRKRSVACKSACVAFGKAEYCCSGEFANPNTCKPSNYSKFFKKNCPQAYSYAFDDGSSTFTCVSANYVITFCPSPLPLPSLKASSEPQPQAANVSGCRRRTARSSLAIFTAVWVAVWRLRHLFLHGQNH